MKAAVFCGDRAWVDPVPIQRVFDRLKPDLVIVGGARGADTLSEREARLRSIKVERYDAKWEKYGRAAGPIRNSVMLDRLLELREQGWDVSVQAFHSDLRVSKGTANMVGIAHRRGVTTEVTI